MLLKNFISLHRVVFCAVRTIWRSSLAPGRALLYLRKPKTLEYQGFQVKRKCTVILSKLPCIGGCGGGIRTPGILLPNLSGKLFMLVYSGFQCFLICFTYSLTLLSPLCPHVPAPSVVIYVVKNASRPVSGELSPVPDGKRFTFQTVCIVTPRRVLCKLFLRGWQLSSCGAIDKEE